MASSGRKRTPKKKAQAGRPKTDSGQPAWTTRFLLTLRDSCNIRASCDAAGIVRSTAYARRESNAVFAAQWEDALEDAIEALEASVRLRAMTGDATLAIFLLKAHRPERYRDRFEMVHKGDQTTVFIPDMGGPTLTEEGD